MVVIAACLDGNRHVKKSFRAAAVVSRLQRHDALGRVAV